MGVARLCARSGLRRPLGTTVRLVLPGGVAMEVRVTSTADCLKEA